MIEKTHKTLGIELQAKELSQGLLEAYLIEMAGKNQMAIGRYYGEVVRAAIKCGWLIKPEWTLEDVPEQKPTAVRWVAEQLDRAYGEATTVPPE